MADHKQYGAGDWKQLECVGWWAWLYIGGSLQVSEQVCRKACFPKGLCVTIEEVEFVFAGGIEIGIRVGFIQYPPFVEDVNSLLEKAILLGKDLAEANFQWSYSIVTPTKNLFFSRRV